MMKEMKKFGIACSALMILAVLILSGCSSDGQQENDSGVVNSTAQNNGNIGTITNYTPDYSQVPEEGEMAPDFQYQNADGEILFISDLKGKAVLLNFWQVRCPPCVHEMPFLQQVYEEWVTEDFVMLAVNVGEATSTVNGFIEENELTFPILLDTARTTSRLYAIRYVPTTYFIDKEGILQTIKIGAFQSPEQISSYIETVIN